MDIRGSDHTPGAEGVGVACPRDAITSGLVGGGLGVSDCDMFVVSSILASNGVESDSLSALLSFALSLALLRRAVGIVHVQRTHREMKNMTSSTPKDIAKISFLVKVSPTYMR